MQCDDPECLKWRKMPAGWTKRQVEAVQDSGSWLCSMNPDPAMAAAGCAAPEEQYAAPLTADTDRRNVKRRYKEVLVSFCFALSSCQSFDQALLAPGQSSS